MTLDPKRTFDELIERLAAGRARARRDPRQPHLPAALGRGRRLAGVHRRRQALRAARVGSLRRARPRHAALAQRARLPRRPRPADRLLRGPRAEGLPRADRARRARRGPRHERRLRRAAAAHRRRPARGPERLLPGARRPRRRLPRARRGRQAAARRPGDDVPGRHFARSASPSRRRSSSPASCRRRGCASAGSIVNRVHRLGEPGERLPDPTRVAAQLSPKLGDKLAAKVARTYGEALGIATRDAAAIDWLREETGDERADRRSRSSTSDVHDVAGLLAVHAHLFALQPDPGASRASRRGGQSSSSSELAHGRPGTPRGRVAIRMAGTSTPRSWTRSSRRASSCSAAQSAMARVLVVFDLASEAEARARLADDPWMRQRLEDREHRALVGLARRGRALTSGDRLPLGGRDVLRGSSRRACAGRGPDGRRARRAAARAGGP